MKKSIENFKSELMKERNIERTQAKMTMGLKTSVTQLERTGKSLTSRMNQVENRL